jgi:hypothetical protein
VADYIDNTNAEQISDTSALQKVLYLNFVDVPQRVIQGEIFSITIKTLSTVNDFVDIHYDLANYDGLELFNSVPQRSTTDKYYYDTFYFLANKDEAKLPDITASLVMNYQDTNTTEPLASDSKSIYKTTTLLGKKLNVITLNPKKDFSNIIANSFDIVEYKTTSYDDKHNILLFVATATNCDIKSLKFDNVFKQGIESMTESYLDSRITYYMIINKNIQNFSFSYFNLTENKFLSINIPIVVDDDSVTTQSDLKPTDQSHEMMKMNVAAAIAIVGIIFIYWTKRYIYLVLIFIPLVYVINIAIPSQKVCIKQEANIYLLPVSNGTIFETTAAKIHLQKEGSVKGFVKVKLRNNKIGWIKNEDICSY